MEPTQDEMNDGTENKDMHMMEESHHNPGYGYDLAGVTSFEQLEAMKDAAEVSERIGKLSDYFGMLAMNIISEPAMPDVTPEQAAADKAAAMAALADEFVQRTQEAMTKEKRQPLTDWVKNKIADVTKQETKTEGGVAYPAADFAYTPDRERPSGWKLRLAEGRPGNITIAQLGRAAAAFSPGGFRGQRVQIPADAVDSVKARIRREYRELGVEADDIPASVKEAKRPADGFSIKQLDDGRYRWTAIYSNNFRDEDSPPEIISAASHRRFEKMVDKGEAPYPELWYYHNKDWKLGQADFIAWDDLGFAIASGLFDEGAEGVAQKMMEKPELCDGVSHGMPFDSIKRSPNDTTVIIEHITKEISPLPKQAAANKLTGFIMDKEANMAMSKDKREAAAELGIETTEATAEQAERAKELELESKEKNEQAPEAPRPDDIKALRDEVGDFVKEMAQRFGELVKVVEAQQKQLAELTRTDAEKIKEAAELTPAASLKEMFTSAIGSDDAKINGNEARRKENRGPQEAPPTTRDYQPGIAGAYQQMNELYQARHNEEVS